MAKVKKDELFDAPEVGFDDVVKYVGECKDLDAIKKISKVVDGRAIYIVNVLPFEDF